MQHKLQYVLQTCHIMEEIICWEVIDLKLSSHTVVFIFDMKLELQRNVYMTKKKTQCKNQWIKYNWWITPAMCTSRKWVVYTEMIIWSTAACEKKSYFVVRLNKVSVILLSRNYSINVIDSFPCTTMKQYSMLQT